MKPEIVHASTVVGLPPPDAFEVFTQEIDAWWKSSPRYRFRVGQEGTLRFQQARANGERRLVEVYDAAGQDTFEVGRVLVWEPGERIVFEFRAGSFAPDEVTEVDVRFEPNASGTLVSLEHRGWERLAPAHDARHGLGGPAFTDMMGLWWSELLRELQKQGRGD